MWLNLSASIYINDMVMNMKRQNHTFVKTKKILRMSFRVFIDRKSVV